MSSPANGNRDTNTLDLARRLSVGVARWRVSKIWRNEALDGAPRCSGVDGNRMSRDPLGGVKNVVFMRNVDRYFGGRPRGGSLTGRRLCLVVRAGGVEVGPQRGVEPLGSLGRAAVFAFGKLRLALCARDRSIATRPHEQPLPRYGAGVLLRGWFVMRRFSSLLLLGAGYPTCAHGIDGVTR
jgi:hypothetical protein